MSGAYFLISPHTTGSAQRRLDAMANGASAAGWTVQKGPAYPGPVSSQVLVVWGAAHPHHAEAIADHREAGGRVVCVDHGFVDSGGSVRIAIDEAHSVRGPWRLSYTRPRFERWAGLEPEPVAKPPSEPVLVVGQGRKSTATSGEGDLLAQISGARAVFRRVSYRPKPRHPVERGAAFSRLEIDTGRDALSAVRDSGLVVCRHSGLAVTAAVVGRAVVSSRGAASSVYPRTLAALNLQPSDERRLEWLGRLSWFVWHIGELASPAMFRFFASYLEEVKPCAFT